MKKQEKYIVAYDTKHFLWIEYYDSYEEALEAYNQLKDDEDIVVTLAKLSKFN